MSSIGPQIPAHLLSSFNRNEENESDSDNGPQPVGPSIGPQIPAHIPSTVTIDDDDDDGPRPAPSIGPEIPLTSAPNRRDQETLKPVAGPSIPSSSGKRTLGPSLPTYAPTYNPDTYVPPEEDSDDDDVGPKPLPVGMQHQERDAVKEFLEREEKRKKALEEASKPKVAKRDEWMLVPPSSTGLLGTLDPAKLSKGRQFSRGGGSTSTTDNTLWTETPAERQQRLADEVAGKKRRVTDVPAETEEEKATKRRRKQEESAIRKGVEDHTRARRGGALVDQHKDALSKKEEDKDKGPPAIWDHTRDMGLGGRLMDDDKRNKMLKEAKGLGDRFGSGKSGGFL